jgi:alkylation response protein AidB-like acyl-CoA dehydrogenase
MPVQHELMWEDSEGGEAIGPDWAATIGPDYFMTRAATIYGGSNEIQRNVIAKHLLGL